VARFILPDDELQNRIPAARFPRSPYLGEWTFHACGDAIRVVTAARVYSEAT